VDTSHEPVVQTTSEDSVAATVAEIHFYLQYGMVQQAHAGLAKLEGLSDDRAMLDALRIELAQKSPQVVAAQPELSDAEEISSEELIVDAPEKEAVQLAASAPAIEVEAEPTPQPISASSAPGRAASKLDDFVADLEAELPEDFMAPAAPAIPPAHITAPLGAPAPHSAFLSATQTPQSSAAGARPAFEKPPVMAAHVAPQASATPIAQAVSIPTGVAEAGADLNDMFDELRAGLEDETAPTHEDPEDHYNLGVAFREMGLIDEAIGELQKVCQSIDRGVPFKYTMQAYTWLAQCFFDKGVPEASIRWYEKALKLPNLDEEGRTALHYELASAYEAAQNKRAALAHFMEVYGANIDYRDVGERIHALKS
jgi:tetratricopeptide (TPR) repeat protein